MSISCHSLILKRLLSYLALSFQKLFKSEWVSTVSTCFLNDPKWHFFGFRCLKNTPPLNYEVVKSDCFDAPNIQQHHKYQILPPAKLFVKGRYTAVSVCSENDNGVRNENMGFCGRWRRQSTSVILVKCMTTRSSCLYKFQNFILTSTASEKSWISMGHSEHGAPLHHCTTQWPSKAIISLIYLGYVLAQYYLRIMVVSTTA